MNAQNNNISSISELLLALEKVKSIKVFESQDGIVFSISSSLMPWRWSRFEDFKTSVIQGLSSAYLYSFVCFPDASSGELSSIMKLSDNDQYKCYLFSVESQENLLKAMGYGEWGAFFSTNDTNTTKDLAAIGEYKPVDLISYLHLLSADVGIISWYDDSEWIVGVIK